MRTTAISVAITLLMTMTATAGETALIKVENPFVSSGHDFTKCWAVANNGDSLAAYTGRFILRTISQAILKT